MEVRVVSRTAKTKFWERITDKKVPSCITSTWDLRQLISERWGDSELAPDPVPSHCAPWLRGSWLGLGNSTACNASPCCSPWLTGPSAATCFHRASRRLSLQACCLLVKVLDPTPELELPVLFLLLQLILPSAYCHCGKYFRQSVYG